MKAATDACDKDQGHKIYFCLLPLTHGMTQGESLPISESPAPVLEEQKTWLLPSRQGWLSQQGPWQGLPSPPPAACLFSCSSSFSPSRFPAFLLFFSKATQAHTPGRALRAALSGGSRPEIASY